MSKNKTKAQLIRELEQAKALIASFQAQDTSVVLQTPRMVYQELSKAVNLATLEQEHFWAIHMNARQKVLHISLAAKGTVASVDVHPRDIFRDAVRMNTHSIILAHNHPSADPTPSEADKDLTSRMAKAGVLLGIPVLDHLVVTRDAFYSFACEGLL